MSNSIRYGLGAGDGFGSVRTWNQTKIYDPDGSGSRCIGASYGTK